MILNTTYTDKENEELINDLVGKRHSFWNIMRLKGVGSKRMIIENTSPNMLKYLSTVSDLTYANIELRPGGIIVHINKNRSSYSWAIPFYQMVVYKTGSLSIHAQGRFIRFRNDKLLKENKAFLNKMLEQKINYDQEFSFPHGAVGR